MPGKTVRVSVKVSDDFDRKLEIYLQSHGWSISEGEWQDPEGRRFLSLLSHLTINHLANMRGKEPMEIIQEIEAVDLPAQDKVSTPEDVAADFRRTCRGLGALIGGIAMVMNTMATEIDNGIKASHPFQEDQ